MSRRRPLRSQRGSSLVEFALVTFWLMLVIFAGIEFDRMVLVYTTVAEAARVGVRYAITHGCDRTGSGASGPSGSGSYSQVQTVVQEYAATGALTASSLTVNVNYLDTATSGPTCSTASNNTPGARIQVKVTYPYNPLTVLPLSMNISSSSEGIITY